MFDPILIDTATPTKGSKFVVPAASEAEQTETADALFSLAFASDEPKVPPVVDLQTPTLEPSAEKTILQAEVEYSDKGLLAENPEPNLDKNAPIQVDHGSSVELQSAAIPSASPNILSTQLQMPSTSTHRPHLLAAPTSNTNPATSPHAHGPEGPNLHPTQAEDHFMQLSRPNRLRTFPSVGSRFAPPDAAPINVQEAGASTVRPVAPVFAASGDTSDLQRAPQPRVTEVALTTLRIPDDLSRTIPAEGQFGKAREAPSATMLNWQSRPDKPISHHFISTDARPAQRSVEPTSPQMLRPSTPQVVAAYTTIATIPKLNEAVPAAEQAPAELSIVRGAETTSIVDPARARATPNATPEHVAAQLARIAQDTAMHKRDILLNPEELGRVRLNLSVQDSAVHVAIMVERPETLDLMRRYISQLALDFQDLGYDDVSFDFAQSSHDDASQDGTNNQDGTSNPTPDETVPLLSQPAPSLKTQSTGTLDLRL